MQGIRKKGLIGLLVEGSWNVKIMLVRHLILHCCSNHDGFIPISHTIWPIHSRISVYGLRIKWASCFKWAYRAEERSLVQRGMKIYNNSSNMTPNGILLLPYHSLSLCRCLVFRLYIQGGQVHILFILVSSRTNVVSSTWKAHNKYCVITWNE